MISLGKNTPRSGEISLVLRLFSCPPSLSDCFETVTQLDLKVGVDTLVIGEPSLLGQLLDLLNAREEAA